MSDVTLMTLMTLMTMMMMVTENITDTTNNCIALLCFAVFLCRQIVRTNIIYSKYDAQINKIIDQLNTQRTTTDRYRKIDTCFAFRDQMNQ